MSTCLALIVDDILCALVLYDSPASHTFTLSLHDALPISVIAYYVHPVNIQTACLIMEGAEFTENIINGVERPVKAAELTGRSEERFSRNAETDIVCRLLLEKKKTCARY